MDPVVAVSVLGALFDWLAATTDDIAEQMATAIRGEYPVYADFADEASERAWLHGLRATLTLFVEVATAERGLSIDERRHLAIIGENRADQGVPLDVVLGSVRLAMHVALSAVRHGADELREVYDFEDAFDELSLAMTRFVNAVSTEISRGYIARSEAQATNLERDRAQFGSDLLGGAFRDYAAVASHVPVLGLTVPPTVGLVLVPASGSAQTLLSEDLGRAVPSALVVPIGWETRPHIVLVVPAAVPSEWTEATKRVADVTDRHRITAVLVRPCDGPQQWHDRYVQAAGCLGVASSFAEGRSMVEATELVPAQLVASAPRAPLHAIEQEVLDPIRRHRNGPKLLRSLDALMRSGGSCKGAARLLGVAAETARRHKATIEQVTGLDFDRPLDAMHLALGWLLLRHSDEKPAGDGVNVVASNICPPELPVALDRSSVAPLIPF